MTDRPRVRGRARRAGGGPNHGKRARPRGDVAAYPRREPLYPQTTERDHSLCPADRPRGLGRARRNRAKPRPRRPAIGWSPCPTGRAARCPGSPANRAFRLAPSVRRGKPGARRRRADDRRQTPDQPARGLSRAKPALPAARNRPSPTPTRPFRRRLTPAFRTPQKTRHPSRITAAPIAPRPRNTPRETRRRSRIEGPSSNPALAL